MRLEPFEYDLLDLDSLTVAALRVLSHYKIEEFWHVLSASQIETFKDCKRKWAYEYVEKLDKGDNYFADFGSAIHGVLEEYLRGGQLPRPNDLIFEGENPKTEEWEKFYGKDILEIISPGIPHLPAPGEAKIEGQFYMNTVAGMVKGFKDFTQPGLVGDHKTTSDVRWAKKPDELRENPQAVLYAADEVDRNGSEEVTLRWVYYARDPKRPKAKKVEVVLSCQDIDSLILPVLQTGIEIQRHRLEAHYEDLKAKDFEPDPTACEKYGGCPFNKEGLCQLTPQERLRAHMAQLSIKDKMKKKLAAKAETETETETKTETKAKGKPKLGMKSKGAGAAINPPVEATPSTSVHPTPPPTGGRSLTITLTGDLDSIKAQAQALVDRL